MNPYEFDQVRNDSDDDSYNSDDSYKTILNDSGDDDIEPGHVGLTEDDIW